MIHGNRILHYSIRPKIEHPPLICTPIPPEGYIRVFVMTFNERNASKLYELFSEKVRRNHTLNELKHALEFADKRGIKINVSKIQGTTAYLIIAFDNKTITKTLTIPVVYRSKVVREDSVVMMRYIGYIDDWIVDRIISLT